MQNEIKFMFMFPNIMNLITSIIMECVCVCVCVWEGGGGQVASKTNGLEERGNSCKILVRNLEENGSFVKLW